MQLVECVPNFSEGRNEKVINAIADSIRAIEGVNLLDIDPGWSTNRTVMTFVGPPQKVAEAAFQCIQTASSLIDMRRHTGEHPRIGATDVCPFVPVSGATMEDCVVLARQVAERVGRELEIPVYLYAEAAARDDRRSLADIRKGEYEGLAAKMLDPSFVPDFGPARFNAQCGATVIGARPFLIAYNVNLNTRSKKLANEIALNIRETGRSKKNAAGELERDSAGNVIKVPGILSCCRAVGWYVDEYERAQVSINLLNWEATSLHHAFDQVCQQAEKLGLRVTGSEIVGLVPLQPMLQAGRHYLSRQGRSTGVPEAELLRVAVQSLGLSDLAPFDPEKKVIEYRVRPSEKLLRNMTVYAFLDELSSDSVAPGGGSVAALCGSLSASLSAMVANLTYDKKGFESARTRMDEAAVKAQALKDRFMADIDNDMQAFNRIVAARRLPKTTDDEKLRRNQAIWEATKEAIRVPLNVLLRTAEALELAEQMVEEGNPNSLSDAGVAGLTALAAAEGAYFNVLINLCDPPAEDTESFLDWARSKAEAGIHLVREAAESLRQRVLQRLQNSAIAQLQSVPGVGAGGTSR